MLLLGPWLRTSFLLLLRPGWAAQLLLPQAHMRMLWEHLGWTDAIPAGAEGDKTL